MTHASLHSLAKAVETHYEELRQFVRKRTGSATLAEEVVQETWIRASTAAVELPDNPRAYLYRMASNLASDQMRRERSRARYSDAGSSDGDGPETALESVPCPAPGLEDVIISQRELAALNTAIHGLPEKCREVFLLYRGHGLTMREVSARLGITEKTVEKHIARAMIHCRKCLRDAGRNV